MQFKRYAVLAMTAMTLTACGSDDPTNPGGQTDAQRMAQFAKFNDAFSNAFDAGAFDSGTGFLFAGFATLFGSGTADVTVGSNGAALRAIASEYASAVAGSYEAVGISWTEIEDYGGGETFEFTENWIVAYRDTTNIIGAYNIDGALGSFSSTDTQGFIYESGKEWIATAGSASLSNMDTGSNCSLSPAIQQAIEAEIEDTEGVTTFTCQNATFSGSLNITESTPNTEGATGSRTASFTRDGLPGVRIVITYDYSGAAR